LPLSPLQLLRSGERGAEGRVRGRASCENSIPFEHQRARDRHRTPASEAQEQCLPRIPHLRP